MNDLPLYGLAFALGGLGFLITMLGHKLVTQAHVSLQHRAANDRVLQLVHQLVNSKNEQLLLEHELEEALQTMPIDRALWVKQMQDIANALPPLVLQQMQRFGLAMPPPELPALPAPMPMTGQQVPEAAGSMQLAQVITPSAWSGQAVDG